MDLIAPLGFHSVLNTIGNSAFIKTDKYFAGNVLWIQCLGQFKIKKKTLAVIVAVTSENGSLLGFRNLRTRLSVYNLSQVDDGI